MEGFGAVIFICIVWAIIAGIVKAVKAYRQKIRDQIAHEILDNIDLQKEKQSVLNINSALNFAIDKSKCPLCGSSLTNDRRRVYGIRQRKVYGGFLICSNYRNCKFSERTY
jgi:hypothetical protein